MIATAVLIGCSLNTEVALQSDSSGTGTPDAPGGLDGSLDAGRVDAGRDGAGRDTAAPTDTTVPRDTPVAEDRGRDARRDAPTADAPPSCVATDEVCNARDDDCDGEIDGDGVCAEGCSTHVWGGHLYLFCDGTRTFDDARAYCEDSGYTDLVVIESLDEDLFVETTAHGISLADWWIGIQDPSNTIYERVDGVVIWRGDGAVEGQHNRWRNDRPENLAEENCTELDVSGDGWADHQCSSRQRFVCERRTP